MRFAPFCFLAGLVPALAAQEAPQSKTARVTYLSGSSVYISAGREDGLREQTSVDLLRGGATVAQLKVAYLSSHQASCTIVSSQITIAVGDTVRFVPAAAPSAPAAAATVAATPSGAAAPRTGTTAAMNIRPSWQRHALRGRIAFRYLDVNGRDSMTADLSQPAVDLNLEGHNLGGSPVGLLVDARTRYTTTSLPGAGVSQDGLTRVYQAAFLFNSLGSPLRFTAGRQYSPVLSSVSYFDGLLTEYSRGSWGLGALAGFVPDPATLQFSTQIREYGGYFQLHNRPTAIKIWSLTLGAITSSYQGHQQRDFAFLQGNYTSRRVSAFLAQEVDFYAPSKQALGEPAVSPTSTLANMAVRVGDAVTLSAGFDNRRTVRLYQDVVTPVTLFDDSFREGVWGGISVFLARRFRLSADVRSAIGGPDVGADAYTVYLSGDRLTPLKLNFRVRSSRYINSVVGG
ncbi:MAG TPA: hypothetical protein VEG33_05750, partial [Streptosporangiaceae bacterium]|nr:hypothetical protein [Streptosporangiaceae bacterium]